MADRPSQSQALNHRIDGPVEYSLARGAEWSSVRLKNDTDEGNSACEGRADPPCNLCSTTCLVYAFKVQSDGTQQRMLDTGGGC